MWLLCVSLLPACCSPVQRLHEAYQDHAWAAGAGAPDVLWSRGYYDLIRANNPRIPMLYFTVPTEARARPEFMAEHFVGLRGLIWLRLGSHRNTFNDLATFVSTVLPSLREPIDLLTSDGDLAVPSELQPGVADELLAHPMVRSWRTQNYDGSRVHAKLRPWPIGLDLHSGSSPSGTWAALQAARRAAPPFAARRPRVLVDAVTLRAPERRRMVAMLAAWQHVDVLRQRLPYAAAMRLYAEYQFVVSAHGDGLDCHRTWEVLALGGVPIVRADPLQALYRDLPVVTVADWDVVQQADNLPRWAAATAPQRAAAGADLLARSRWLARPL